ncbi:MAG: FHA domain-containing protein [Deltaproteobacteria bacterium]|nr:FHA domain-containing protein [Deltaproteobacteria bacterium]
MRGLMILDRDGTRAGGMRMLPMTDTALLVGRSAEAGLVLDDPALALRHLRLGPGAEWVEDLGGRLGTRLNGQKLEPGHTVPMRPGDEIEAGTFLMRLVETRESRRQVRCLETLERVKEGGAWTWRLEQQAGPGLGRHLELSAGEELTLGRGKDCALVLDDPKVSRRHLSLSCSSEGRLRCRDMGSTNGVRVNGRPLRASSRLRAGSRLSLGPFEFFLVHRPTDLPIAGGWTIAWLSGPCKAIRSGNSSRGGLGWVLLAMAAAAGLLAF